MCSILALQNFPPDMNVVLTKPIQAFDSEPIPKYVCSPVISYTSAYQNLPQNMYVVWTLAM